MFAKIQNANGCPRCVSLVRLKLTHMVFCTPMVMSQTSGFSQQGKVTHEMKDEGFFIAHSSLPLNSKAKIANTSTGKEVEVTITRLIPASQNRIADVSPNVWQELGLSSDTDARIYTVVTAKPQTPAPQAAASPAIASSAARAQEPAARTAQAGTAQAGTASGSLGDMPSGVKFENNNNFIINGNPVAPTAVASETRTQTGGGQPTVTYETPQPAQPAVTYYAPQPQPAQPAVTYYAPQPQPAQPAVTYYAPQPQQAQPAAVYETPRPAQPANDIWAQIIKPAAAFETRPAQPAVTYETPQSAQPAVTNYAPQPAQPSVTYNVPQPQQAQSSVTYYAPQQQQAQPVVTYNAPPQYAQPVVRIENWSQTNQPIATPAQGAPSAVVYDAGPQQAQPTVKIYNWQQERQPLASFDTQTQTAQPVPYETRQSPATPAEKILPDIRTNTVNEILTPASRTFVLIDASPETPVPSVTVDNGLQSYRSTLQGGNRN